MKLFSERNPVTVGAIGAALTIAAVLAAMFYQQLPFVHPTKQYTAQFSEAGGLVPQAAVQVSGYQVGRVTGVALEGSHVTVRFRVNRDIRLGDRTEASIKTRSLLGAKILEVVPRGEGSLSGPIPVERTIPPYELTDALAGLSTTIEGTDTAQLSQSLTTLAETFSSTPPALQAAVAGLSRFADTINRRDVQLRSLLVNARKATGVLANRTDQVVNLVANSNALLAELRMQSDALDRISGNVSLLSQQLSGFIGENRQTLGPAVQKLNRLLTIVANRKAELATAIHRLNQYAMSLGEALSSGPFFNAYVANLLPGQFLQPFIDAAFSDLGLDPNTLPPSELNDPEVGQPATPPLPVPFPRTGQGGEPRLTLPDAITGNPGDQACGLPGAPTSGPGCYPYRQPPPAPAPGGPPPGPPAPPIADGSAPSVTAPTPAPVIVPAPGQPAAEGGAS